MEKSPTVTALYREQSIQRTTSLTGRSGSSRRPNTHPHTRATHDGPGRASNV